MTVALARALQQTAHDLTMTMHDRHRTGVQGWTIHPDTLHDVLCSTERPTDGTPPPLRLTWQPDGSAVLLLIAAPIRTDKMTAPGVLAAHTSTTRRERVADDEHEQITVVHTIDAHLVIPPAVEP